MSRCYRRLLAAAFVAFGVLISACSPPVPGGDQRTMVPARQTIESGASTQFVQTPSPGAKTPLPAVGSNFALTSSAFVEGANIPAKFTCSGEGISPQLKWSGAPTGAKSFALIMDDPDAPGGTFTHWVAFDISATQSEIAEGATSPGKGGKNGRGQTGYTGPCPPSGTHRYFFTLYALDVESLGLSDGASRADVEKAMTGHIIGQSQLMGRYAR